MQFVCAPERNNNFARHCRQQSEQSRQSEQKNHSLLQRAGGIAYLRCIRRIVFATFESLVETGQPNLPNSKEPFDPQTNEFSCR